MTDNQATPIVQFTWEAARQVKYLLSKKCDTVKGLRVGVKGGGCSGFSYTMALEPEPRDTDLIIDADGFTVWVDPRSVDIIRGATVDFDRKNLLGGGFKFSNPNASRTCGCGNSFDLK